MKPLDRKIAGLIATSLVAGLSFAGMAPSQELDDSARRAEIATVAPDEVADPIETAVEASGSDAAAERRKSLIGDAVEALDETRKALTALEDGDTEAALESLAVATGKLDLVIARNPHLGLAPVDVRMVTHDLYATVDDIEQIRERAAAQLERGRLQEARALIEGLRSDLVVEVYNVPLATYPAAIKAITPLIDADELDRARVALQGALNTLVVTRHIHPLPIIRAEHMLMRAEELAETKDRASEQNDDLTKLLGDARAQLEFAQALGYGEADDFKGFYEQLDKIADKTADGRSGTGFFDKIRDALRALGDDSLG